MKSSFELRLTQGEVVVQAGDQSFGLRLGHCRAGGPCSECESEMGKLGRMYSVDAATIVWGGDHYLK